ncbi:AraC family transcriptional regulator [Flavobacterium sp. DGU11]|uniref:AraC family transcriptional regulator n=1 Tax=Flavobacterium arundinis TaxID=3139143 RepID=A0ABU9HXZ1_9FLAO
MSSIIYTLPEGFTTGTDDTLIYFYTNDRPSEKNKVVFTKNMLCLLQNGIKVVHTANGKEIVTNEEVLMLASGSILMSEQTVANKYEAILIFFGNKTLSDFCAKRRLSFNEKSPSKSIFKVPQDSFLKNFCLSLKLLKEQGNSEMNEVKIQEVLNYISTTSPDIFNRFVGQALAGKSDIKIKQVVGLNLHNGLTTEELAFLCDMSVSTFKRHFAALYNMPPQKYFLQQKMDQAKLLLSLQKRPSEIYAELGYENLSAFSNEFKKHFGLSPKQFQTENGPGEKAFGLPEQQFFKDVPATL